MAVYTQISDGSSTPLLFKSPLLGPVRGLLGSINGSLTTTFSIAIFPLLVTLIIYSMVSPAATGVQPLGLLGVADFTIDISQLFILNVTAVLVRLTQLSPADSACA